MIEKIKRFYNMGLYTDDMVHRFVERGVITEEQYREIVATDIPPEQVAE